MPKAEMHQSEPAYLEAFDKWILSARMMVAAWLAGRIEMFKRKKSVRQLHRNQRRPDGKAKPSAERRPFRDNAGSQSKPAVGGVTPERDGQVHIQQLAQEEDVGPFRIDRDGAVKLMANEILGLPTHIKVGHINGDVFDNRRCNLYIIDPERN
ncbi:hypothetical protein ES703_22937 [subsurface metagenome]